MKPALKPGDIVEYTGRKGICVGRIIQITAEGFNMRVLMLGGKEYKEKNNEVKVLNTQWETANFRIRLQLVK